MKPFEIYICNWKNDAKAALTITFDGAYSETYDLAMPPIMKYGFPATWFVVTGSVGEYLEDRQVVDWKILKQMNELGMEIGSHTVTHPRLAMSPVQYCINLSRGVLKKGSAVFKPRNINKAGSIVSEYRGKIRGVSSKYVLDEAIAAKKDIESRNISDRVLSFAYPGGKYTTALKKGIENAGYLSARATLDGYNHPFLTDYYSLKSKVWKSTTIVDEANRWVDSVLEKSWWVIETFHIVSKDGKTGYRYDTSSMDFEEHLNYINEQGIWVDTQQTIIKYIRERNGTKIKLRTISDISAELVLKNSMDGELYNQALTLKTFIPLSCDRVHIKKNGDERLLGPVKENEKSLIYFEMLPNKDKVVLTLI